MGWWNDYGVASWMHFGPLFMALILAGCGLLMYFMMRGHRSEWHGDSATQILKERFARGEIDKAEYEERRRVLDA